MPSRACGPSRFPGIDTAITLLDHNPQIEQVITHVLPIEDVNGAFAIAADAEISGKVPR